MLRKTSDMFSPDDMNKSEDSASFVTASEDSGSFVSASSDLHDKQKASAGDRRELRNVSFVSLPLSSSDDDAPTSINPSSVNLGKTAESKATPAPTPGPVTLQPAVQDLPFFSPPSRDWPNMVAHARKGPFDLRPRTAGPSLLIIGGYDDDWEVWRLMWFFGSNFNLWAKYAIFNRLVWRIWFDSSIDIVPIVNFGELLSLDPSILADPCAQSLHKPFPVDTCIDMGSYDFMDSLRKRSSRRTGNSTAYPSKISYTH
jgi:hypothetical protein